ncbi:polyprenol phosphomannose-dependent alpha 1,6 mannosyltransferase MptB [Flavobacterium soyangense]|uniref:Polyprenol phosphomannose-dependent alpha 1,6 mannosyltransferase MptB n=1 Tax=Flavobacterium soyangense TaxID=2023265 RepID=A0A930UEU7_9FLAO|nr:polyprenol phosphomannose-dependent alpha 1,6 mannosyltransferase MptB [Flavobacterium soyangense]
MNPKYLTFILAFLLVICYSVLGYFFERQQFGILFLLYATAFVSTYYLIKTNGISSVYYFKIGLFFRIILLFSTPFLSQDFYRFIWDGRLIATGINPYGFLPNQIINSIATFPQAGILYEKMGSLSASHFSNYPPFNQFIFALAGVLTGKSILGSILVFRIVIILADIGIYYFGRKLLLALNQNPNKMFWYFLNPLVLIELTGNLHFEGVMLFFFVGSMYLLHQGKWKWAALVLGLSISTKLLPLLFLPLFFQKFGFKKSIVFYGIVIGINLIFFLPFLSPELIHNYSETIGLWFTNFEFNASIYYVIREIGFWITGYNVIHTTGKIIPILMILYLIYNAFFGKCKSTSDLLQNILIVLSVYFFTSTTVHPWYIINLVVIGVFTKFKFPIVWSFLIILSYFAYSNPEFKESIFLLIVEYSVVYGIFFYEITKKSNSNILTNPL